MSTTADSKPVPPFLNVNDPEFDFGAPEVMAAQDRSWCAYSSVGLLVLRHHEAQELMRDPRLIGNGKGYMEMNGVFGGPVYDWFVPMISNLDGPVHRRLRGLVNKAFTPRMIANLRPFVREVAQRHAERLATAEVRDFVREFADPVPHAAMCELLGVPAEEYDVLGDWTTDISLVFSLPYAGDVIERVERGVAGLDAYVGEVMAAKAAAPGEDLISALVTTRQADDSVSTEELRNLIVTMVFAAHDTTRHQMSNAVFTFAGHPDQWTLLAQRPELVDRAVEEVMRWCPAADSTHRFAAEDLDYRGLRIPKDTFITVCLATAQRDPRVHTAGDRFDITVERTAPVLQFGTGPHHCLGAAMARAELAEALGVLTTRLGPPSVVGEVVWRPPFGVYGPSTLPLRFG